MFHASGVVTTNQTIQDNREAANIKLTTLDISKLETNATTNTPTWTEHARLSTESFMFITRMQHPAHGVAFG